MLASSSKVVDVGSAAVEPLIPQPPMTDHPVGCHRPDADGYGRSQQTGTGSRSRGRSMGRIATTWPCSDPPSAPSPTSVSTIWSVHANGNKAPRRNRSPRPLGCDGPSSAPTRGFRTTASSARTLIGASSTGSLPWFSPSLSSSPSNSSNGQNGGTNDSPIRALLRTVAG